MRVFISWSGQRSHEVAIALKNFIGDIMQSVTPFVSDEDIISGERWNHRLKVELQENQYGILSITQDNKDSPWLLFEAGALSNSPQNIPVVPFLYGMEPSDLTGSPLLQFQAAIYSNKEYAKKLVIDINEACGESKLDTTRLDRAFDRCYPEFEEALKKVSPKPSKSKSAEPDATKVILEEVLDLTRGSQKLLSSIDNQPFAAKTEMMLRELREELQYVGRSGAISIRRKRKLRPMMVDELLRSSINEHMPDYGLLICLSVFRDEFPWLYDAGKDLIDSLKLDDSQEANESAFRKFSHLIEFSLHNPMFEINSNSSEYEILRELPMIFHHYFMRYFEEMRSEEQEVRPERRRRMTLDEEMRSEKQEVRPIRRSAKTINET